MDNFARFCGWLQIVKWRNNEDSNNIDSLSSHAWSF